MITMKKLSLFLATILLLLNLACDEDNNDSGNGDDPTNGTPNGTKTPTNGPKDPTPSTPTPTPTTVDIPENLRSNEPSPTTGAFTLSWNEVEGTEITYKLREGGEDGMELSPDPTTALSHTISKTTGSYRYQVQACDASDTCSDWSSPAITVHVFRSDPPANLMYEVTSPMAGTFTLSWNSLGEGITYKLREVDGMPLPLTPAIALSHTISKTTGSYAYQVQACHTNTACTDWSDARTVHVFRASAPTLTFDETTPGDGSYTLSWDAITDAATYELREASGTPDSATTLSRSVTGKATGSYDYRVRACHTNTACTAWSSTTTAHVFVSMAPTWTSTETTSGDGSYALSWDAVTDAATYKLREGATEIYSGTGITHSISGNPDGSYSYQVQACHTNGACTAWSDTLIVTLSITCADTSEQDATGFNYGAGTVENPYLICTYDQLKKMRENSAVMNPLEKHYKLGAHIDASESRSANPKRGGGAGCTAYNPTETDSDTAGHPADDETCTGWVPVGNTTTAFTGSLQGAHYTIRNLYVSIASGATRVGLFGETGSASVIQNVGVTNAYIQVDTIRSHAGGLVGENQGSLRNSYASGSVSGVTSGGLVGWNTGSISNSYAAGSVSGVTSGGLVGNNTGSISNSYTTGSVYGGSFSRVGGLVGRNAGSISNSYATGTVTPNTPAINCRAGGLVGNNDSGGSISNSYATGTVTGASDSASISGGLVGWNQESISNSYAAGSVSGYSGRTGGLVGFNNGNIRGKNYFVYDAGGADGIGIASCNATICIRAGTTGQTDTQRRTWLQDTLDESTASTATPAGLGWSTTHWRNFGGGTTTGIGYPLLKYANHCSDPSHATEDACLAPGTCTGYTGGTAPTSSSACMTATGRWTPTNTWLIACGGTTGVTCGATIANCGDDTSIGEGTPASPYLVCNYDQLKKMRTDATALAAHYQLVRHIDAIDSRKEGGQRDGDTGGCTAYDSSIASGTAGHPGHDDTCTGWAPVGDGTTAFTGSLQGAGYEIRNLYISIKTTTTRVGLFGKTGRAGVVQNLGVTDAYIEVGTASSFVGGLVGWHQGSLSNSYASGSVSGGAASFVGGLVGRHQGSISNSYASGSVSGGSTSFVGGLLGYNNGGSLSNSYASGSVSGGSGSDAGGLLGWMSSGSLSNSYATGSVIGGNNSNVGGLVGRNARSLSNSYASGSVSGGAASFVGGLVGRNDGTISGKNYFVDGDGTRGIGTGTTCVAANCIQAGDAGTTTPTARQTWLQDTLDESADDGMDWPTANWENFTGADIGYPLLKYAAVAGFCTNSTYMTRTDCENRGTCTGGTTHNNNKSACEGASGTTWVPTAWWLAGGDECGGTTGVVCGARIPGQD